MEPEVVNYIKEAQKHGLTETEIKQNLLNAGWSAPVVEESMAHAKADENKTAASHLAQPAPVQQPQQSPAVRKLSPAELSLTALEPNTGHPVSQGIPSAISDQQFQKSSSGGFFKSPAFLGAVVALVVLGGGGYLYYAYAYNNPAKIWKSFQSAKRNPIFQNKLKVSYTDNNKSASPTSTMASVRSIKFGFDGQLYNDASNPQNPQSSADLNYTFSAGNTTFGSGFGYRLIDKILYVNVGDNPILNSFFAAMSPDQKVDWISLDLNALQDNSDTSKEAEMFNEIFNPSFRGELQKMWDDSTFVTVDKYLGTEKIDNVATLHFKNNLDKQAIKNTLNNVITKVTQAYKDKGQELKDSDVAMVKSFVNALVDKIQVKQFETWVGRSDFKLYKVHFASNAPSVLAAIDSGPSTSLMSSRTSASDAKRLADIRQMASALELYFNDNNSYPESKDGKPIGLTPTYIGILPTAPTPPGGNCTDYYNSYWYQTTSKATGSDGKLSYPTYEMTFCLGSDTGGYHAGIAKLSQSGIQDNIPCPSTPDKCVSSTNASVSITDEQNNKIKDAVDKLNFSADFDVEASYSNYGQKQKLEAPEKFLDIMKVLNSARAKSRDAKRLADVRQLSSALELYFNDFSKYPNQLKDLTPTYIGIIPASPNPADGSCSDADNQYSYAKKSDGDYELYFCLGDTTGGYPPGKNKLSPQGIQPTSLEQYRVKNAGHPDEQRLGDIRLIASAQELYFNDNNSYPKTLSDLKPKYIIDVPTAPMPPGGSCSAQDNNYSYKFINSNSYELSFCLGQQTGGYADGKHMLTQAGIQ